MTENICPFCLRTESKSNVNFILNKCIVDLTLIKVLLHVILVLWVEEVVATFSQQIGRHIAENVHHALIDKGKFAIHGMSRDEFRLIVGSVEVGGVGSGRHLQAADGDQAAVRRVHVVLILPVQLDAWKDIYQHPQITRLGRLPNFTRKALRNEKRASGTYPSAASS